MASLSEKLQYIITVNADGAIRSFQKVGQSAERELGKAETSIDRLGAQFTKFGVGALATAGVAGVALAEAGRSAATLGQSMQKVGVVFGDSANQVKVFAESAAENLGLSQRAALDAAARFATFGKVANKSGADLVDYSTELTKRAVDLASFWDTDLEAAFTAISSGLQGEALPLRKYGILLDDITLRKRALSMEIYDGIGPLTAQQRVMAASVEIMQQNVDSIGDYERTSQDLPNLQKRFSAELQNTKDSLGTAVLPAMKSVVGTAGDLLNSFNSLDPGVKNTVGTFAGFGVAALGVVGVAGTVVGQAIKMRENFAALGSTARTAAVGIGVLTAALVASQAVDAATGSGAFADLTEDVNKLIIALGNGESSIIGTSTAITDLVNEISSKKGVLDKAFDLGDVALTGATRAEKWNEMLRDAFDSVQAQSTDMAQEFVDSLRRMDEAARNGSQVATDWMSSYDLTTSDIDELQAVLDNAARAAAILAGETEGSGDAAEEAARKFGVYKGAVDQAKSGMVAYYEALQNDQAFMDLAGTLGEMQGKLAGTGLSAAEQAANINKAKMAVIDYAEQIGGLDANVITEIMTVLDKADYQEAADALARLAAPRTSPLRIQMSLEYARSNSGPGGTGGVGPNPASAFNQGAAIAKQFADAFNAGMSRGSKAGGSGGGGGAADTPKTPEEVMAEWDTIIGRLYELGEWDVAQYREHLESRLGAYAKYSDDYMRVWNELQQLNQASADAQREELEAERDLMADRYELGEIDRDQYRAFLTDKLAAYEKYSDDYMAVAREIAAIDKDIADDRRKQDEDAQRAADDARRAADEDLARAANRAIVAANIGGATYASINTLADPNAVVNAIQQYVRRNGPITGIT